MKPESPTIAPKPGENGNSYGQSGTPGEDGPAGVDGLDGTKGILLIL